MPNLTIKISKKAIIHNLKILKKEISKDCLIAPAIKANAYGHGLIEIARLVEEGGANWLCVTSTTEAAKLRSAGINLPILIIGPTMPENATEIIESNSRVFLYSIETAKALNKIAKIKNKKILVHLKLDTGMNRQGIPCNEVLNFIKKISNLNNLIIEGVATHFATADEDKNNQYFLIQLEKFIKTTELIEKKLGYKLIKHCANSAATMLYPQCHMNMCRIGIAIYGCYPSNLVKKLWEKSHQPLKPVMSVFTKITQIKELPADSCVSYGCTYRTKNKIKIATIPVGYFEGLPRLLSNQGYVWIKNKKVPIIGRVCMDITVIDISNIKNIKIGDEVEIIGKHISAETLAQTAQTINYEILTNWKESIPRFIVN